MNYLKRIYVVFLLSSIMSFSQVGIGTTNPSDSAELEISSNNRGLLIPRIALTSVLDTDTITNGNVDGLTVFNITNTFDLNPGYYYWYDGLWRRLLIDGEIDGAYIGSAEKVFI
ncbi:MAG: hypothetical protein HRT66_05660 [Flavobacteriaceae bacterium]|nr:hypothetical protein [Flavobacteriaceae bacterium]